MKHLITLLLLWYSGGCLAQLSPVANGVYRWAEHEVTTGEYGESRAIVNGTSPHFEYLKIHAVSIYPDAKPVNTKDLQNKETCIIVKEGNMKVTMNDKVSTLDEQSVLLLMPDESYTIENIGKDTLTYFVMEYTSRQPQDIERGDVAGGSLVLVSDSLTYRPTGKGGSIKYFDRPTAMCDRFEMHITHLHRPGPSHKPHTHDETEIIMMLSGNTSMTIDGKVYHAEAGDFYFMNSQLMHGISNASENPCSYFAYKWK